MKKYKLFLIAFLVLISTFSFSESKEELKLKKYFSDKTLAPKDLNPKTFIKLFVKEYGKNRKLNQVTLSGEFPKNWVKENDLKFLISRINSTEKCCGYMNIFSSYLSSDDAEVGGFAIIFMKSYIENKKIDLGLNCNPKVEKTEVEKILKWYKGYSKKLKPNR